MARQFLLLILGATFSFGSALCDQTENQVDYPAWFLNVPQSEHGFYAVGICQPCLENDFSMAIAASDGVWKIVRMHEMGVSSRSGVTGFDSYLRHMGKDIVLVVDSALHDSVNSEYMVLEKHYFSDMLLVLIGPKSDSGRSESPYSRAKSNGEWWRDIPKDGSNYYAVGLAPAFHYESSSWDAALTEAILDLASQQIVRITGIVKYDGQTLSKTIEQEGTTILRHWHTVARHYSPDIGAYFVLIRMPGKSTEFKEQH